MAVAAEAGAPGTVLELLDHRPGQAARTFPLQGGMGDVKVVVEHSFDLADNLPLAQTKLRGEVDMGRQG